MRVIHVSFDEEIPSDVALSLVRATIAYGDIPEEDYAPRVNKFTSNRTVVWTTQENVSYFKVSSGV